MNKKTGYIGFIGILIAAFLGVIDSTIVNIALPSITDYFKVSLNDTSWISTIYALALAVFMITASKLADQFGRKKLMVIGLLIFGISSVLCGFSNSLLFLIVMRFIQGIGGAIITPIVLPMGIEIFGKEKMQIVVGASGAVVGLAAASGPPVGGILIKYANWQSVFFVNVPLTVIALILIMVFAEESYDNTVSKNIDWVGMIMITVSLFCLTFALLKGKDYGWNSPTIIALFAIFAVSLIVFVIVELKISAPMVEFSLFKEPTFTASNICYLITGFGIMCPLLIFNYYIQNVLEYDTLKAAFIMMSVSLTTMFATPIGSILSKKIGTRIVNFLGILILGIATFKLSYVNADMTKGTMILDLIICGIGLGFSVQALSSSVKFIPKEKSGMGSGIINAARQIGSCIGIAILVSILNSNVSTAKDNIKNNVISYISNKNEIIKPVRTELIKVVSDNFKNTDSNRNTISQSSIEKSVEDIIKNNKSLFSKNASFYNNDTLKKLYDGTSIIRDGASKAANGQSSLNSGMKNLDNGLDGIYNGSVSLNYGLGTFNDRISKLAAGSQKLADGSQGITALINGITSLDSGSQKLIGQFSSSGDTSKPSLYDGITFVSDGTQKVSSGVNNYVAAVNSTLYMLVKNNADAAKVLDEYRTNLSKLENDKSQDIQQIKMLSNMVSIYTAAISSANESEFESKLAASQNVVSSGQTLKAGADNLQNGASKVEAQFKDSGAFKSGVAQLAAGTHKLSGAAASLTKLQDGIGTINTSISKLSNGSSKLYDGSSNLKNAIYKAKVGNDKLEDGSSKLVDASYKIKDGTETVVTSIGMAGQKGAIQSVMNKVKSEKDDKLSTAFSKTFLISSIIVMISSIFGLFTDKNVKIKNEVKECDKEIVEGL